MFNPSADFASMEELLGEGVNVAGGMAPAPQVGSFGRHAGQTGSGPAAEARKKEVTKGKAKATLDVAKKREEEEKKKKATEEKRRRVEEEKKRKEEEKVEKRREEERRKRKDERAHKADSKGSAPGPIPAGSLKSVQPPLLRKTRMVGPRGVGGRPLFPSGSQVPASTETVPISVDDDEDEVEGETLVSREQRKRNQAAGGPETGALTAKKPRPDPVAEMISRLAPTP